ncbi:MAG TPA: tetratricopeptide repeat protein [Pyrinomonadaceae bacterium]|jgi:tetratricopeptide (TPR) repeat protein|nr:tetratricopeptide repeat protein [Pyrinomonadaceae bacterium]
MPDIVHYCQKCLAANALGQEFCVRCGTRLMIIVEPAAARYEGLEGGGSNEEHLLERISALENRLGRLTGKLERGLDLLLRHAQNAHFDRALVKTLVALLSDEGTIQGDKLERLWIERCQKDAEDQLETERRQELRLQILASYHGHESAAFEQFINEGFVFIDDDQPGRGIRCLQRAAEIASDNALLLYFIGEHFFKLGKTNRALTYLARAYEFAPRDRRISLLLGLTCADEGDLERAKELLHIATRLGGSTFAAHYGLGRLFVAQAKWRSAVQEFKLALATKTSPEAHYALGCLYFQLSRDALAARHLKKALEMDADYGEAFYVLGLISERAGQKKLAVEYFQKAGARALVRRSPSAKSKRQNAAASTSAPLFSSPAANVGRLITGGDRRLAEVLRQDALNACSSAYDDRR